jgi:hypothetical protein
MVVVSLLALENLSQRLVDSLLALDNVNNPVRGALPGTAAPKVWELQGVSPCCAS